MLIKMEGKWWCSALERDRSRQIVKVETDAINPKARAAKDGISVNSIRLSI